MDLIKFAGEYWVVDGHNRVAAALYTNGAGLDAMVTELVPLDGHVSEKPTPLLSILPEAGHMRAAAAGLRPAAGLRQWELSDRRRPGRPARPGGCAGVELGGMGLR